MPLSSSQRAHLRGLAMRRDVDIHVGRQGVTPAVVAEVSRVLDAKELAKLKFGAKDHATRKAQLEELAAELKAEEAGAVGRTAILYRRSERAEQHLLK